MCSHAEVQQSLYRQKVREQAISPELPDISENAELLAASGQVFGSTQIKCYSYTHPLLSSVACQSGLIHLLQPCYNPLPKTESTEKAIACSCTELYARQGLGVCPNFSTGC